MGIILGIIYCICIYVENRFFSSDILVFGVTKAFGYLIIISGIFYTAFTIKKEYGGYITFQESLRGMLVVIAIFELFYVIFNLVYDKYIDPEFFMRLKTSTLTYLQKNHFSKEDIDIKMKNFEGAGKATFWTVVQSYGFSIIIDAVFAVIFASILKKNPIVTDNQINP